MSFTKLLTLLFTFLFSISLFAQDADSADKEKPNGKRIRRQLNMIVGVEHDEELLIPDISLITGGRSEFFKSITRIKNTDYFRFVPQKAGNGIVTLKNKETGQIIVEIRFDIRDDTIEKTLREMQALLADIEGIEFKLVGGKILIDGYVLLPKDIVRMAQVLTTFPAETYKNLVTLSPVSRQKIAVFISNDINNPEVKVTAIGDFIKLEGQVNSEEERARIKKIVGLYMPDVVSDKAPQIDHLNVLGKKMGTSVEDFIIDFLTVKKDDEKVEPPPKMIQIVAHFVKFNDKYEKSFSFSFAPLVSAQNAAGQAAGSTITETATLINNLLPKLNWAKFHGFAKVLDTASVLTQDKKQATIVRTVTKSETTLGPNGQPIVSSPLATVSLNTTPTIKSERSGLIEFQNLAVEVTSPGKADATKTNVNTTISVRDRQSAAFGGIIRKDAETSFGAPNGQDAQTLLSLKHQKSYSRNNSQFVVFITPIIKSSASSGVEQVKKKFRLRD